MSSTKIRVTMSNNSDARKCNVPGVDSSACRHNGGKVVVCTVDAAELDAIKAELDASHSVAEYEVVS